MKNTRRQWFSVGAVLVAVVLITVGIYYGSRFFAPPIEEVIVPEEADKPEDTMASKGVRIEGGKVIEKDEHGTVLWSVRADGDITYDETNQLLRGRDVAFVVNVQGQPAMNIKAPEFTADYDTGRLVFTKGVAGEMVDKSGEFSVQRLEYQTNVKKLVGTGGAQFRKGLYNASADTIVFDLINRQTRLRGNVKLSRRR